MTAQEFKNKIDTLIADLPFFVEQALKTQAESGLSIVKDRSINQGIFEDSEAGVLAQYSTRPIKTSRFKGKELNQGGRQYIKTHKYGTWHDFRKAQGLTSPNVNASYTNRFWSSLKIIDTRIDGGEISCIVSPTDSNVMKYAPNLFARYGNFINPTEDEQLDLKRDTTNDIFNFIKRRLR